jgi:beta-lactamase class A
MHSRREEAAGMLTEELVLQAAARVGLAPASFVVTRLDRAGQQIAIDADHPFYPASMIKTALALAAFSLVQSSVLNLDETYQVTQANMTANDKESPLAPGFVAPLRQLIELMLTISDNVATNMLFDALGRERATEIVQKQFGLGKTEFHRKLSGSEPLIADPGWDAVHRNSHPAGDAARLFELIARDEVPFADLFRSILGRQQWSNKLPAGLHPGDRFAHKTGDTDEVTHDGGILDTEQGTSYVLVVYTGMVSNDANNARFGPFMSAIRPYL